MTKKILALGGGNIGEIYDGKVMPYETEFFDEEIINLSDSNRPRVLFLGLADPSNSDMYFHYFSNVFCQKFGCICKDLKLSDLRNQYKIDNLFNWCDVVYVGGGNTFTLVKLCQKYGLVDKLLQAYNDGKVMCGVSAGGMCWFKYGNSINPNNKNKLIKQDCFGFENMVFAPHCDEINGHFENVENLISNENLVAISLSNCCALEIVDDKFRFLNSNTSVNRYKIAPFGIRSYWDNDKYILENIELNSKYAELNDLLIPRPLYKNEIEEDVKKLLKKRNIYFKQ